MAAGPTRGDGTLVDGLERWIAATLGQHVEVVSLDRPSSGWSNETVIVTWDRRVEVGAIGAIGPSDRAVIRLPALVPSYPVYDLDAQAQVLTALGDAGLAVPAALHVEHDGSYLGAPFLVMALVEGHSIGDVAALDPWFSAADEATQVGVQRRWWAALASVHRSGDLVERLGDRLRHGLDEEIAWWDDYVRWAGGETPTGRLLAGLDWCLGNRPQTPPESLLWGDARLGNAMFGPDATLVALLDWELATIGPAEMDVAWYQVIDLMTERFVGPGPPAILDRNGVADDHAEALGRTLRDLAWHRVFALCRSIAVNDCQARLAAAHGLRYPGVAGDANPLLDVVDELIAAAEGRSKRPAGA